MLVDEDGVDIGIGDDKATTCLDLVMELANIGAARDY